MVAEAMGAHAPPGGRAVVVAGHEAPLWMVHAGLVFVQVRLRGLAVLQGRHPAANYGRGLRGKLRMWAFKCGRAARCS